VKATRKSIEEFLSSRKIAIAGVSRDPKKFGHTVMKELKEKGFEVFPINPNADQINGTPCFHNIGSLPLNVKHLLVITQKKQTHGVVTEAIAKGIDNIWIQQFSETKEAIDFALSHKVNLVVKQCILMHTEPVKGIHKFHRSIKKFFGTLPK
jgi:predicted CoA-binding protein